VRGAPFALEHLRERLGLALLVVVPLVAGASIGGEPAIVAPLILLIATAVWFNIRRALVWWDLLVLVVAGVYLLDYGFANVGVPGQVPIPIVDLVALLLMIRAATRPGFRWPESLPFVLAAAFVGLTVVRLSVDLPHFGVLAIRDATLGFELAYLFIGYWAIKEYGLPRVARMLSVIFVVGLAYVSLYPFRDAISSASPLVGLQRPVPLFGTYAGAGIVVTAAFFYFALVRPFGARSYVLAAAALPLLAMLQSRGLYIAVPMAMALVWTLGRKRAGTQVRKGLALSVAVGVVVLAVFFPFAPEGRLGKVSPSFIVAQIQTLSGREGPSSGTITVREEWFSKVMDRVSETPLGWAFGVGLGPDLASGVKTRQVEGQEDAVLVRKPHDDYLEMFARYGLLGLALFVGMLGTAFLRVIRGARVAEGLEGGFLWFAVAQTVVLALIAAAQPLLAFPYGTIPLFLVLGVALAVVERPGAERDR
jgi:O-antigen ligase